MQIPIYASEPMNIYVEDLVLSILIVSAAKPEDLQRDRLILDLLKEGSICLFSGT